MVDELKGSSAPVGHIAAMCLMLYVLLPSAACWLAWLLWGLLDWINP